MFVTNMFGRLDGVTPKRPVSRRARPAKPALTYEGIVATAVALMRAEGLERVTMRRLAKELDTGPASLYVYVADTTALHAAVLGEMLAEVDLRPVRGTGDWRDRIVAVLRSYTRVLFAHPALARAALATWPSGDHYLALVDGLLALLAEGGVRGDRAAWGVDLLLQAGTATAAEQVTRDASGAGPRQRDTFVAALRDAAPGRFPHLAARAEDLLSGSGEDRLTWHFRVLITGIERTARP